MGPPVSFSSFVTSLAASAMEHLGMLERPSDSVPNLVLARQTIDLIDVLKTKTTGNLDNDEQQLLETLLRDLRMHFDDVERRA
jgi:hypothetical protein